MTIYTANTTFYLRWESSNGQSIWTGSNASSGGAHPLDNWQIRSTRTTFYWSSNHAPIFARILDTGSQTTYGAKFNTDASGCNLTFTPSGPLELEPGMLISDDPKIQIKSGGTTTPCIWTWHHDGYWTYQIGTSGQPQRYVDTQTITLFSANNESVPLTIIDETLSANRCALYRDASALASTQLPSGTSVNYIDAYALVPGSGTVSVQAKPSLDVYTLNLFVNPTTRLAMAPT
jgi:hypothetical protein